MKGATSGAYASRIEDAVAGPTPFRIVSSVTALEMSGRDLKAFSDADFTRASSSDETKSSNLGLKFTDNSANEHTNIQTRKDLKLSFFFGSNVN